MVVAPVVAVVRTVVVSATGKRRRNSEYGQCNGKLFHLHSLLCVLPAGHYSKTQWTAEAANGVYPFLSFCRGEMDCRSLRLLRASFSRSDGEAPLCPF